MNPKFDSILFDLDGTLSDSFPGIEKGIYYSLKKCGVEDIHEATIKKMIGLPLNQSLSQFFFDDDYDKIDRAINHFREYYNKTGIYESILYPGVVELLHELHKNSNLYIITAKPTLIANNLLIHHNANHYFKQVLGFEPHHTDFKKSELILSLNLNKKAIMIGDKKQDIIAGKAAGLITAGVKYGYGSKSEIENANPDHIISSVINLKELLL